MLKGNQYGAIFCFLCLRVNKFRVILADYFPDHCRY